MTDTLWIAVFVQMAMGAFDTFYHHEGTERLAWRPSQRTELRLHGVRNLAYAVMFGTLGWAVPQGWWAVALLALLAGELFITLWDFVEEDRTRHLPATERVTHTLLTLNYGVILALLVPWLLMLTARPTSVTPAYHGLMSWFCLIAAVGVVISGLRDLAAAGRTQRLIDADAAGLCHALDKPCTFLVTGGTGFIGTRLVTALTAAGHQVTILTRDRAKALASIGASPVRVITALNQIASDTPIDVIVNLAGEPISDSPWTRRKRQRILRSRLRITRDVVRLMARMERKPSVFISGSAVGYYGLRGDERLTEDSDGSDCFSRRICVRWEQAAQGAEALGVRTILLRTGLVLDRNGGMLARLLTPFEFGLGGRIGHGRQWMSWIHRDDLVRLMVHCIASDALAGPVNAVAPRPVTNQQFTRALGRALRRPTVFALPRWPLRLALGSFADELLLSGQHVLPARLRASGFTFRFVTIDSALAAITGAVPRRDSPDLSYSATIPALDNR